MGVEAGRSTKLLEDLSGEKVRWSSSSQGFASTLSTMCGDILVCGAFATYSGFFDLFMRKQIMAEWMDLLEEEEFRTKSDLSVIENLCTPADRLGWKENALPDDDLCYENAIILKRFIRYPLIIDPSGQAI